MQEMRGKQKDSTVGDVNKQPLHLGIIAAYVLVVPAERSV